MKKILFVLVCFLLLSRAAFAQDTQEEKSRHFIVYYDEQVSKDFVGTVIDFAERYYDELVEKLNLMRTDYWTWDKRAIIYVYPDQETYVKKTGQPSWSGGLADYSKKTIWTFPMDAGFFDSLLPHEIGHIVLREAIGSGRVPLWFEEGIACYMEQAKRFGAEKIVLDALRSNTFIPMKELMTVNSQNLRNRSDVALFYAESVSVINFLMEKYGVQRFSYLFRKIKERKSFDDALAYTYFDIRSSDDLGRFWERYLKDKLKK